MVRRCRIMIIFAFTKTILNFMKQISTSNAPAAIGPYSQAIEVNGFVYTSGQLPIDPATGAFPEGGVQEQTRQSLLNVQAILAEAGLTLANVVKTTVFLADMGDFAAMNDLIRMVIALPQADPQLNEIGDLVADLDLWIDFRGGRYALCGDVDALKAQVELLENRLFYNN